MRTRARTCPLERKGFKLQEASRLIWTKLNRSPPPADIYIYVLQGGDVEVRRFTEQEIPNLISLDLAQELMRTLGAGMDFPEDVLEGKTIIEAWSFIPVLPPEEVMPILGGMNQELISIQEAIKELREELASIPRITSLTRIIEDLQRRIAARDPDPYHKWKEDRLKEKE